MRAKRWCAFAAVAAAWCLSSCENSVARQEAEASYKAASRVCSAKYDREIKKIERTVELLDLALKNDRIFLAVNSTIPDEQERALKSLQTIRGALESGLTSQKLGRQRLMEKLNDPNKLSRYSKNDIQNVEVCSEAGAFFDMKGVRDFEAWSAAERERREVRARADALQRINSIKNEIREQAETERSAMDAYGATKQIFGMQDGAVLECTTDLSGPTPTFWCEDGAEARYLKKR